MTRAHVVALEDHFLNRSRCAPLFLQLLIVSQASAVSQQALTTTTLTLSVTPDTLVTTGTALTLQAAVSTVATPVTQGSVTFYDGARVLAAVQVVYSGSTYAYGTANRKLYLGPGSHAVKTCGLSCLRLGNRNASSQANPNPGEPCLAAVLQRPRSRWLLRRAEH